MSQQQHNQQGYYYQESPYYPQPSYQTQPQYQQSAPVQNRPQGHPQPQPQIQSNIPGQSHIQINIPNRQPLQHSPVHNQHQYGQNQYHPQYHHQAYYPPPSQPQYHQPLPTVADHRYQPQYQPPQPQQHQQHQQLPQYQPNQPQQYRQQHRPQHPIQHTASQKPPVLVSQPTFMQQSLKQPGHVLHETQPNNPRHAPMIKTEPEPDVKLPSEEPEYGLVLLALADEYILAATKACDDQDQYCKLMATALGCLESTLTNFKLPPLREAQTSLKYAQLLFDETENNDDAETLLTKTIELCDLNKFLNVKYAMQLLLARILHKSKPKAAIKDLRAVLEDVEAYKHIAWEYPIRFQIASLLLASGSQHDLHAAISEYQKIQHISRKQADHAILAFAAICEATGHLRTSSQDSANATQRALAKARALQLDPDVSGNPQMMIMMDLVDLCCSVEDFDIANSDQKRQRMQKTLYQSLENKEWGSGSHFYIPIKKQLLDGVQLQDNGLIFERKGRPYLCFSWLAKDEVEAIGYLLSAISSAHKNAIDGGKSEKFVEEGLQIVREAMQETKASFSPSSQSLAMERMMIEAYFLLELTCLNCAKGAWEKATVTMEKLEQIVPLFESHQLSWLEHFITYLKAVIAQGRGYTDEALKVFQSPAFDLSRWQKGSETSDRNKAQDMQNDTTRNLAVLAAINVSFIIYSPKHPQHHRLTQLLSQLEPLVPATHNKNIQASHSLLISILPNNTILKTKSFLNTALSAAQSIGNAQITALVLVMMQEKFFKGQVGDQAVKCARAASAQVRRWGDPTWAHVTTSLEADCYEVQGWRDNAEEKRRDTVTLLNNLPNNVRDKI